MIPSYPTDLPTRALAAYRRDHPQHAAGLALLSERGITGPLRARAEAQRDAYVSAFCRAEREAKAFCELVEPWRSPRASATRSGSALRTGQRNQFTRSKGRTMTTYTTYPTKTLKKGDRVVFTFNGNKYKYIVYHRFLEETSGYNNRQILVLAWGKEADYRAALSKAYGYAENGGDWPEYEDGDYAAATRAVRAVFRKIGVKPTPKQRAAQKKADEAEAKREAREKAKAEAVAKRRAQQLAALDPKARAVVEYLQSHTDAFGCQRCHVAAIVGALIGVDIASLIKTT